MHQSAQNRPRLRAASATFPLSLELRNDYRPPMPTQSPVHAYPGRNPGATSQYTSPSIYTTSYPPAPLTAPINMSHPRPSNSRDVTQDHAESQLSAPLHAPSDFASASGHNTASSHSTTSPSKDSFVGGPLMYNQNQEKQGS